MSGRWWRAYDEALHDPKLIALPDKLHRAWFNLLCVASKHGGILPAMSVVAIELRITLHKAAECVTSLVVAGLFDEPEPGKFSPHNWSRRQFQSDVSTDRVKRFRQQKRNVSLAVSETPPETDTEAKTERKKDAPLAPLSSEKDYFTRAKELFGKEAGGLASKLLSAKGKDVLSARIAMEQATAKKDPREYIWKIIHNMTPEERRVDPRL